MILSRWRQRMRHLTQPRNKAMLKTISKFIILAISIVIYSVGFASYAINELPQESRVPGGIAIIDLKLPRTNHNAVLPTVYYLGNRTLVLPDPNTENNWITIVGIPLNAKLGANTIHVTFKNKKITKSFIVKPKKYPEERITVHEVRKVSPLQDDKILIEKQYLEIIKTYATWTNNEVNSAHLILPVHGRKSSPFGLRRIMNNVAKDPHSGLDIAAPIGTEIKCPLEGQVINIGNFFYNGNTVFVDHGQGFITSYCHLSSIAVKTGQKLQKGDAIGQVGRTGRVTGAHLHWSVSLNNVRVDPQLFIDG